MPVMIRKSILEKTGENFYMKDVARGSSAAPTYFEPHMMTSLSGNTEYCLIDGAMAANNPALCAYVEARTLFPHAVKFLIISIGTGRVPQHWDYKKPGIGDFLTGYLPRTVLLFTLSWPEPRSSVSVLKSLRFRELNISVSTLF